MTNKLEKNRGKISSLGGWRIGGDVISNGYSILNDLDNDFDFIKVMTLNATGKMLTNAESKFMGRMLTMMSWPDSRLWCNTIGALSANSGCSPISSVMAGGLAAESRAYAAKSAVASGLFLQNLQKGLKNDETIKNYLLRNNKSLKRLIIPGFQRPIANGDERISISLKLDREAGLNDGCFLLLAMNLSDALEDLKIGGINFAGYVAARFLDMGLRAEDVMYCASFVTSGGIIGCHRNTEIEYEKGGFLPLACDDIDYNGVEDRCLSDDS